MNVEKILNGEYGFAGNYRKSQVGKINASSQTLEERLLETIGNGIAKELQLKKKTNGRYDLKNGDKTALGLARTVISIIQNGGVYGE